MSDVSTPCQTELMDVNICVESNAAACAPCFDYGANEFIEEFPQDSEDGFRKAVAFIPPVQKGFCDEANYRVCENQGENMDCCCQEEIEVYTKCSFNNVWVAKFGVVEQCEYLGCAEEVTDEVVDTGGETDMSMIYIIAGACGGALVILSAFFCWRYRKLQAAKAAAAAAAAAKKRKKKAGKADAQKEKKKSMTKAKGKSKRNIKDVEQGSGSDSDADKSDDDPDSSDDESDRKSRKSSNSKKSKAKKGRRPSDTDDDDTESTSEHAKNNRSKKQRHHHHHSKSASRSSDSSKKSQKSREEELERERIQAEREAKLARLEKQISVRKLEVAKNRAKVIEAELGTELAETEAEKQGMAHHMKQMELERMLMEQRIAELQGANDAMMMMEGGYISESDPYLMAQQANMMPQNFVVAHGMGMAQQHMIGQYDGGMTMDDGSTLPSQASYPNVINAMLEDEEAAVDEFVMMSDDDDDDDGKDWLAQSISRRVDNLSSSRRSHHCRHSNRSKHKSRSRSRSHSKERLGGSLRKPRSMENLASQIDPAGLSRSEHHHRPRSRSSENIPVPTRGISRSISDRHDHKNSRYSAAHMIDHAGSISGADRMSSSRRSRSKESIDRSSRTAPSRSKSDSISNSKRSRSSERQLQA